MADDRGASRPGDDEKRPGAKPKKRVRTRQPTLIGMAVGKTDDPTSPPVLQTSEASPIQPPAVPPPARPLSAKTFPKPSKALGSKGAAAAAPPVPAPPKPKPGASDRLSAPPSPPAAKPAASDRGMATSPATAIPPTGEAPTAPSIEMPLGDDDDLPSEPTQITGPDEDEEFLAGAAPLEPESTQVTPSPDAEHALDSVPPRSDLAMQPTIPAASMPEPRRPPSPSAGDASGPGPSASDPFSAAPSASDPLSAAPSEHGPGGDDAASHPDDLPSSPTVVVNQDGSPHEPAPMYSFDVESGAVAITQQPTWVGDEPTPPTKISGALMAGLAAGALLLMGGGALAAWLLFGDDGTESVEVAAVGSEGVEPASGDAPTGEVAATDDGALADESAEADEAADDEAADDAAADDEAADDEAADDEAADDAAADDPEAVAATGEVIPRETLEGFDLELPRTARRARRMTQSQRRRVATRLKARALRAYRGEEHAEAERLYREALTYNSWDVAAVEGLARATAQQSRHPEALAWAELAVERNPRSAAAYRVLGDVWRQAGHPDEAARVYRRGMRRNPRDRWLRQRLRDLEDE